MEIMKLWTS